MKTKFSLLVAAGLFLALASQAQYHNDYADRRDIRQDRKEIYQDRNELYQDRRDLRQDERYGNLNAYRYDKHEQMRDRRDYYMDRRGWKHGHVKVIVIRQPKVCY